MSLDHEKTIRQNPPQLLVEEILLAVFHLVDARAALINVHINKQQMGRRALEDFPRSLYDMFTSHSDSSADSGMDVAHATAK